MNWLSTNITISSPKWMFFQMGCFWNRPGPSRSRFFQYLDRDSLLGFLATPVEGIQGQWLVVVPTAWVIHWTDETPSSLRTSWFQADSKPPFSSSVVRCKNTNLPFIGVRHEISSCGNLQWGARSKYGHAKQCQADKITWSQYGQLKTTPSLMYFAIFSHIETHHFCGVAKRTAAETCFHWHLATTETTKDAENAVGFPLRNLNDPENMMCFSKHMFFL